MTTDSRSRAPWLRLAGALLLLDGAAALLLSGFAFLISMFPPVAAIEGRASPDQSQWGLAVGSLALAVAAFRAGWRAIRGRPSGLPLGAGAALVVAVFFGWWMLLPEVSVAARVVLGLLVALHLMAAWVLARSPGSSLSHAQG